MKPRTTGDHLGELKRRQRAIAIADADLALALNGYYVVVARLHDESGLSYGQLAPMLEVSRSRVQQLTEQGRRLIENGWPHPGEAA